MASINTVSIELELKGQQEVTRGLKNLAKAQEGLDRGIRASVDSNNKNAKSLDRIMREAQKAQREMDRLSKAVQKGTITQGQFLGEANKISARLKSLGMANAQSEVMRYYSALTRASAGSKMLSTSTSELTKEMNRLNVAQSAAGSTYIPQTKRQTNQLGVVFQQAGYQVGDFAVQVQSGTNVMVALGQQLTQLVGVGAMLSKSTKWIAAFSLAGVIVPIATAIAGAFMRVSEESENAKDGIKKLEEQLESAANASSKLSDEIIILNRGLGGTEELAFLRGIQQAQNTLTEAEVKLAEAIEKRGQGSRSAVANARLEVQAAKELVEQREEELSVFLRRQEVKAILEEEKRILEERNNIVKDIIASTDAEIQKQQDRINLAQTELQFGKESQEYRNTQIAIEERILREQLAQNDILGNNAQKIIDAWKEANNLEEAIAAAGDETGAVASGIDLIADRARVASQAALGIFQALRSASMAMAATEAGIAAGQRAAARGASEFETKATQAAATEEARLTGLGVTGPELSGAVSQAYQNEMRRQQAQAAERALYAGFDTGGGGGGGGGAAGPNIAEEFERLKRSIDDAYEASQKFKESKDVLDRAMASGIIKTTEEYNRLLGLLREEYDLTSEKGDTFADNMMKIAQTARDALGDAFMSIVDGTKSAKDAFADMARIILKQAFELLVIKPILDGIFGGLTGGGGGGFLSFLVNANGNAFSGGNVIPFANGGVVGGPTVFPMSGGRMGLMGEAGPEAIMPLKRGKGGKLGVVAEGSSQPVNIYQTFQFSANGDESVKRIIAQEAPKIANLTQKQVLEARSRGGAFRTTFGA